MSGRCRSQLHCWIETTNAYHRFYFYEWIKLRWVPFIRMYESILNVPSVRSTFQYASSCLLFFAVHEAISRNEQWKIHGHKPYFFVVVVDLWKEVLSEPVMLIWRNQMAATVQNVWEKSSSEKCPKFEYDAHTWRASVPDSDPQANLRSRRNVIFIYNLKRRFTLIWYFFPLDQPRYLLGKHFYHIC